MLQFKILHMECFIYHVYSQKKTSSQKDLLRKICKRSVHGFYIEICMWGPWGKYHVVSILETVPFIYVIWEVFINVVNVNLVFYLLFKDLCRGLYSIMEIILIIFFFCIGLCLLREFLQVKCMVYFCLVNILCLFFLLC